MVSYHKNSRTRLTETTPFRVILLALCVACGILYVAHMSAMSTKGYDIAGLQKQIATLQGENERLAVEIAKNSSMSNVQSRLAMLQLVPVDHVDYVNVGASVARR